MNGDRYTKIVFTIIAVGLVTLVAQNLVRPSIAQSTVVMKVAICNLDGDGCASVGNVTLRRTTVFLS